MTDLFGNYKSQETRTLARIDSSKYPDTNKDFEANVRRLNAFVDYISGYLQTMQKGVDQATKDPITNLRDTIWDIGILLGGGQLLYGIDLGDLQYLLPAIGTMFGFNNGYPFPINLFYAAEHFLLGYIVPLDSFGFVIIDIIRGWAEALGLSPEFIDALEDLILAFQDITGSIQDLITNIFDLLGIFGVDDGNFGPFGELWHAVTQLLGGFDLETIGDLTDPILDALAPWIKILANFVEGLNNFIESLTGGTMDAGGLLNFASMFNPLNFLSGTFNPLSAWSNLITGTWNPLGVIQDIFARGILDEFVEAISNILDGIPFVGGALSALWDRLTAFVDDADHTASVAADASQGLEATRDILIGNINGTPPTTVDPDDQELNDAIAGQAQSVADNAAAIAALQAVQTGEGNSGRYAIEPFEYTDPDSLEPTLWTPQWLVGTNVNGRIAVADGHNAGMIHDSANDIDILEQYIGPNNTTITAYQKVTITVSQQMKALVFGGDGSLVVYVRMSADRTKWVRMVWRSDGTIFFQYKNGGAIQGLGSSVGGKGNPAVGTIIAVEAGTSGGIRNFRVTAGAAVKHGVVDSSNLTDINEKGAGWGQIYHQGMPGKIAHWSMSDNAPSPVIGTTFRAFRGTASSITKSSGAQIFAANTFDTLDYISSDLTWDPATSKLTTTKAGTFLVGMRIHLTSVIAAGETWNTLLYKEGILYSKGDGYIGLVETSTNNDNENEVRFQGGGMMAVYLDAGDYIQFGFESSSSEGVMGDAGGVLTWVTATRVGVTT